MEYMDTFMTNVIEQKDKTTLTEQEKHDGIDL